ncbi:MAG TPA: type I DNA topoisomerase [Erysipelotrichaceae bacterium]|nr:type I DNA topoisomerase [Erysipelotrichaceae bacterium]
MKLVIVESPAKCITIKRYLGDNYVVKASFGHIRDLATSGKDGLGVDIEKDFLPRYVINKGKQHVVNDLKATARECSEVILATDPDREGEAIAWHLAQVLDLDVNTTKRFVFHEITRDSINEAVTNPQKIDKNLVSSQETRRIIDRIIGFKLSSLLYKKIRARSGGRVQSATLKLIKDHDDEIAQFVPEEYWTISTKISAFDKPFSLNIISDHDKEIRLTNSEQAHDLLSRIPENLVVQKIEKKIKFVESKEPFTTSTLQQEAFSRLNFKTKKTLLVAQQLYEGIEVAGEHVGLITYMRTDSTRLSPTYIERAKAYIVERFGKNYLGRVKKTKQSSAMQDAHEAIRPTSNHRTPESVKKYLTKDQFNLYRLIYSRTLASLMQNKKDEQMTIFLSGEEIMFKIDFTRTLFKGYEAIYKYEDDQDNYLDHFPDFVLGESFPVVEKDTEQKFTQAPAHYSEAKIVKLMEEVGIGRPSTYASTIDTLRKRKYVENDKGILITTKKGKLTATVLNKYFPEIVDVKYTAIMEEKLDNIEEGNQSRSNILNEFYYPFIEHFNKVSQVMYKESFEETGEDCPKCGSPLVIKEGRNGPFVGCSNFPKCKYVKKEENKNSKATPIGEKCPECGGELLLRDKNGSSFISCSNFPKCRYTRNVSSLTEGAKSETEKRIKSCPECDGYLIKKKGRYGYFLGCINYPKCNHMEKIIKRKRK